MTSQNEMPLLHEKLNSRQLDFLDFGCSKGGSLEFAMKKFGVRSGAGIDIDPRKVELSRKAGHTAFLANATELSSYPSLVSFVTMIDFLEHLPGVNEARRCIEAACIAARDFVYIRQPWFDSDGYLMSQNLKLFWSDWDGHPNAMTSLEFHNIVHRIDRVDQYRLLGYRSIQTSRDNAILPLSAPQNQHNYVETLGKKNDVNFDQNVYQQLGCIIKLKGGRIKLDDIQSRTPWDAVLFDG